MIVVVNLANSLSHTKTSHRTSSLFYTLSHYSRTDLPHHEPLSFQSFYLHHFFIHSKNGYFPFSIYQGQCPVSVMDGVAKDTGGENINLTLFVLLVEGSGTGCL